jgi:hypothetical protein
VRDLQPGRRHRLHPAQRPAPESRGEGAWEEQPLNLSTLMELLAIAVRRDREAMGYSQEGLDRVAREHGKKFKVGFFRTQWCGPIERCHTRYVSEQERKLLAFVLQQPESRYLNLETDPTKVIGVMLARESGENVASVLERSIVFPPEYKQAGVAILSYFSEIVANKYPNDDVQVSILQNGSSVTLRVETREGKIEEIEKTLEQYGMVVTGSMPIDTFTNDRELIRDLKTRLEVTSLELRLRKDAYLEQKSGYDKRVGSLEEQVQNLFAVVSTGLQHANSLGGVISHLASTAKLNNQVIEALDKISQLATKAYSKDNEEALTKALAKVQQESPSFYQQIKATLGSIPGGIMANLATPWVQALLGNLPK